MWINRLKVLLAVIATNLVIISLISFWTNNIADAIFYLVLALWIEKRMERMDTSGQTALTTYDNPK